MARLEPVAVLGIVKVGVEVVGVREGAAGGSGVDGGDRTLKIAGLSTLKSACRNAAGWFLGS